jgi:hypothetical protein
MDFTSVTLGSGFDWPPESEVETLAQPIMDVATHKMANDLYKELNFMTSP